MERLLAFREHTGLLQSDRVELKCISEAISRGFLLRLQSDRVELKSVAQKKAIDAKYGFNRTGWN